MTTIGRVRVWDDDEGWGVVVDSAATPGGCWTHFSSVLVEGYASLRPGELVAYEWEAFQQDGYTFRTVRAWPAGAQPVEREGSGPSGAYRSTLTIAFDAVPDE